MNSRFDQKKLDELGISALFHDIGKIGVPDSVLLKPGKLDKNEFEKDENFRSLDLDQRKELLISILDENQLFLNHADMRDSRYHVSEEEMNLTDLFYGAKND